MPTDESGQGSPPPGAYDVLPTHGAHRQVSLDRYGDAPTETDPALERAAQALFAEERPGYRSGRWEGQEEKWRALYRQRADVVRQALHIAEEARDA